MGTFRLFLNQSFRFSGRGAFCWGATPCGEVCGQPGELEQEISEKEIMVRLL